MYKYDYKFVQGEYYLRSANSSTEAEVHVELFEFKSISFDTSGSNWCSDALFTPMYDIFRNYCWTN